MLTSRCVLPWLRSAPYHALCPCEPLGPVGDMQAVSYGARSRQYSPRPRCCSGRDSRMLTSRCTLPWLHSAPYPALWARSATCKPCAMVLVPDSTVHCSRPRCCSGRDSCMLTSRCKPPWLRSAHTYVVHNTYPTLKPRLVFSPLKPRLVEHTVHGHTRRLLSGDVAIRNSLRSKNNRGGGKRVEVLMVIAVRSGVIPKKRKRKKLIVS